MGRPSSLFSTAAKFHHVIWPVPGHETGLPVPPFGETRRADGSRPGSSRVAIRQARWRRGRAERGYERMSAGASDLPRTADGLRVRGRAGVADVIGLVLALEARQSLLPSERRAQDRSLAPVLEGASSARRLRLWVALAASPALALRVRRVVSAVAWTQIGFTLVGGLLGWSATSALLSIRGPGGRVSVAACLAILVGLPFVTWLGALVGWVGTAVGIGSASVFRTGSPTFTPDAERAPLVRGLARLVLRLLPAAIRLDAEVLFGRARAHAALLAPLQRALVMRWLMQAGVGFGLGSLAATGIFVVFTDLAFGWSTTLDVEPERVHRLVTAIARPWAGLWPEASPSLALVEATRHFRVATASAGAGPTAGLVVYGGWWPFLVMAIGCYAVLPRLVTLPILALGISRESERVLRLMPGALELLESLDSPWIESGSREGEERVGRALGSMVPEIELAGWLSRAAAGANERPHAVIWAEAIQEAELPATTGGAQIHAAGGRQSLETDAAVVRSAAGAGGALLVFVRADEPPLLELLDFLAAFRAAAGAERALAVVLVGGGARDLEIWRRKLAALADPRLVVARLARASGRAAT